MFWSVIHLHILRFCTLLCVFLSNLAYRVNKGCVLADNSAQREYTQMMTVIVITVVVIFNVNHFNVFHCIVIDINKIRSIL